MVLVGDGTDQTHRVCIQKNVRGSGGIGTLETERNDRPVGGAHILSLAAEKGRNRPPRRGGNLLVESVYGEHGTEGDKSGERTGAVRGGPGDVPSDGDRGSVW